MEASTSRHNPIVQRYRRLAHGREAGDPVVLLDGRRLVEEALSAGVRIVDATFSRTALEDGGPRALAARLEQQGATVHTVGEQVLRSVSPVSTPGGVVAIAHPPAWSVDDLFAARPPLVILGAGIQDPGNVGAILRAAEAAGASGVGFASGTADPLGWKAVRGSMGSVFRLPTVATEAAILLDAARRHGVTVLAAVPRGGRPLFEVDLRGPVGFLLGGEGGGVPRGLAEAAAATISIPMRPPVESLNVSVAAALLVYEAHRQRTGRQW